MKWKAPDFPAVDRIALLAERRRQVKEAAARGEKVATRTVPEKLKPVIEPAAGASWAEGSAELK